ncbi:hypothetical protein Thpro_022901 [Acidihalobacter prosperus]|uniref:Uncharacterized protein n=1 Tax=Acidihalobacter prosperus TaxID=160660 RepID=A0A1A6C258_9GAMM|nr:hypothetical protein Thpro_022901 [Acidihalobacter prosperus]
MIRVCFGNKTSLVATCGDDQMVYRHLVCECRFDLLTVADVGNGCSCASDLL